MTKERVGNAMKPAEKTLTLNGEAIASAPRPSSSAVVAAVAVAVARSPCPPELAGPRADSDAPSALCGGG